MPTYTYRCPKHGERDVVKSMADAGTPEYCWPCLREEVESGKHDPFVDFPMEVIESKRMRRIYNPQRVIIRPRGYSLRPGEYAGNGLGYSTFDYELERGELTEDPTPVYTPEARAKREEALAVASESRRRTMAEIDSDIPEHAHQELHEWARAVHSHATEG